MVQVLSQVTTSAVPLEQRISDDVRTALLPAFAPLDIVHAFQNGPRPSGMYATVRIETARALPAHMGWLEVPSPIPAPGSRVSEGDRIGTVELQVFGDGAYDFLDAAVGMLATEACMEAALALNLAFGMVSTVEAVPALLDGSSYEERALCSLAFAYTRRTEETLYNIETVEGTVAIENSDAPAIPYRATVTDN